MTRPIKNDPTPPGVPPAPRSGEGTPQHSAWFCGFDTPTHSRSTVGQIDTIVSSIPSSDRSRASRLVSWVGEISMKPLERPTHRVSFRTGMIVFAAMVVLALSSTSGRRVGLAVLAASVVGVPSATVAAAAENNGTAIRPFRVNVPEADLGELRRRVLATRWPEQETVTDHSQGVPLAMIRELARYWATDYDWRKAEAKLNALPQFVTTIDGLDIHFIHVR